MIEVTVGTTVDRAKYLVGDDFIVTPSGERIALDHPVTLRDAIEAHGMDMTRGIINLDSAPLAAGDLNKTFTSLGYSDEPGHNRCFLVSVVKADNA